MLTLLRDSKGQILEHYMRKRNTINSLSYYGLLVNHLKPAFRSKRRGLLSTGVLLLPENARPHTAHAKGAKIKDFHFQCLPHPPYSPDLVPSGFHVFGLPKESLVVIKRFKRRCMIGCASNQQTFFFPSRGIQTLVRSCNRFIERSGDCVEK
jgi:histone-lysine N-methyltransferase SETMAR